MAYKLLPEQPKQPEITPKSVAETAIRSPVLGSAGVLAAIPGFAGNIGSAINTMVANPLTKAFGGEEVPYEQTHLGKILPTTQTHLKNLQEGIPFLKPKNKVEKFVQDFSKDATELFLPGKVLRMGPYAMSPARSAGISLVANGAGEFTKAFTGDESKGEAVKNGVMLGLSLFNPQSAGKVAADLYAKAASKLPQGAKWSANSLTTRLDKLEQKILQGRQRSAIAPSEEFVLKQVDNFRGLVKNGEVAIDSLSAQKRSLNEELQKFIFDSPDKAAKAGARKLAKEVNHAARETMKEYGTTNPEWWKNQSSADQAFGTIAESNYISRVLDKFLRGKSDSLKYIFGLGAPAGLSILSPQMGIASLAAYQGAKLAKRIWGSPELAKHYSKVVGAALSENPKAIDKELTELDAKIQKEEKPKYKLLPLK